MEQLGNLAQRFVWHSNTRGSEDPSGSIGHLNVTRLPPHNIMHYPSLCDLEDIGLGRQLKICLWFRCGRCGTNKPPARIVLTSCWFCFSKYPPPPPEIIYKKHMKSICQWCSSVAWCYSEKMYTIYSLVVSTWSNRYQIRGDGDYIIYINGIHQNPQCWNTKPQQHPNNIDYMELPGKGVHITTSGFANPQVIQISRRLRHQSSI